MRQSKDMRRSEDLTKREQVNPDYDTYNQMRAL